MSWPIFKRHELAAFEKGYRVSADGTILSPAGRNLSGVTGNRGYVWIKYGTGVRCLAHRLQAYQKFGDRIYEPGTVVRHIDGDRGNNSASNIDAGLGKFLLPARGDGFSPCRIRLQGAGVFDMKFTTSPNMAVAVVEPEQATSCAGREGNGKCRGNNEQNAALDGVPTWSVKAATVASRIGRHPALISHFPISPNPGDAPRQPSLRPRVDGNSFTGGATIHGREFPQRCKSAVSPRYGRQLSEGSGRENRRATDRPQLKGTNDPHR